MDISHRRYRTLRLAVLNRDGWTCQVRNQCDGVRIHTQCTPSGCGHCAHVHHITPRAAGGTHAPANLVAACRDCNLALGDRVPQARHSRMW